MMHCENSITNNDHHNFLTFCVLKISEVYSRSVSVLQECERSIATRQSRVKTYPVDGS
jgi:hypothetical protein